MIIDHATVQIRPHTIARQQHCTCGEVRGNGHRPLGNWALPSGPREPDRGVGAAGTACQNTEDPLIHTDTTIAIKSTAPNGDLALL